MSTASPSQERGPGPSSPPVLGAEGRALVRTLLYYGIFRFPLRASELRRLTSHPFGDDDEVRDALSPLLEAGLLSSRDGFFFVGEEAQVGERREDELRAREIRPRALRRSRFIAGFPFVRAVAFSGTFSKGVLKPGDDVDFFVITAPGRVWVCRTLLMLFKKVFLLDSHRLFCVNYLVSGDALAIPDRNFFTATEIAWLAPAVGSDPFRTFFAENGWLTSFLPGWSAGSEVPEPFPEPRGPLKRLLERLLGGPLGDSLDERLRGAITRRNRRRYAHLGAGVLDVGLRSERTASKHHPKHFQERILGLHARLVREFETRHGVSLAPEPAA